MGKIKELDLSLRDAFPDWYTGFSFEDGYILIEGTNYHGCGCCASPIRLNIFLDKESEVPVLDQIITKTRETYELQRFA